MKHLIFGFSCVLIATTALLLTFTVETRTQKEQEVTSAMESTIDEVSKDLLDTHDYTVSDANLIATDLAQTLVESIQEGTEEEYDENLEVTVKVMGVDEKEGLVALKVEETFSNANGSLGTMEYEKIVILEEQAVLKNYTITYLLENAPDTPEWVHTEYKIYTSEEGRPFPIPSASPANFLCWIDLDTGEEAVFPETVTGNKTFVAKYLTENI